MAFHHCLFKKLLSFLHVIVFVHISMFYVWMYINIYFFKCIRYILGSISDLFGLDHFWGPWPSFLCWLPGGNQVCKDMSAPPRQALQSSLLSMLDGTTSHSWLPSCYWGVGGQKTHLMTTHAGSGGVGKFMHHGETFHQWVLDSQG